MERCTWAARGFGPMAPNDGRLAWHTLWQLAGGHVPVPNQGGLGLVLLNRARPKNKYPNKFKLTRICKIRKRYFQAPKVSKFDILEDKLKRDNFPFGKYLKF
jgi:hypothetical protein